MATRAELAIIGIVSIGTLGYYLYTQNQKTPPPPPPTVFSLSLGNTTITVTSGLLGSSYSPSSTAVTMTNATPSGKVTLYDENNNVIANYTADASGTVRANLTFSSYSPSAGTGYLYAVDVTTGNTTAQVKMTYQSSSGGGGGPTNQPGNVLSKSQWTGTGTYGYNTNPVSFGNWAVNNQGIWSVNFGYGPGYYQTSDGSAEFYAGASSTLISYLNSIGDTTTYPAATSVSANPSVSGLTVSLSVSVNNGWVGNVYVKWGDGSTGSFAPTTQNATYSGMTHVYSQGGTYNITGSITDAANIPHAFSINVTLNGGTPSSGLVISPSTVYTNAVLQISVAGLTPSGTWALYTASGSRITANQPLDSTGSGALTYNLTASSPLDAFLQAGETQYKAVDSSNKVTNIATLTFVSTFVST